jgi:hypothetical protein
MDYLTISINVFTPELQGKFTREEGYYRDVIGMIIHWLLELPFLEERINMSLCYSIQ